MQKAVLVLSAMATAFEQMATIAREAIAALPGEGSEPATSTPATGKAKKPGKATFTEEQVREKLGEVIKNVSRNDAVAILTEFGADKLSELDADKYAEVMAAADAKLKAKKAKPADDDDI